MFNKQYIEHLEREIEYYRTEIATRDQQIKDLIDKFVFNRRRESEEEPVMRGKVGANTSIPTSQNRQDAYSIALQQAESELQKEIG